MLQVWNHLGDNAHYFMSFTLPIPYNPKIPDFPVKVSSFILQMMKREKLSTYEYFKVVSLWCRKYDYIPSGRVHVKIQDFDIQYMYVNLDTVVFYLQCVQGLESWATWEGSRLWLLQRSKKLRRTTENHNSRWITWYALHHLELHQISKSDSFDFFSFYEKKMYKSILVGINGLIWSYIVCHTFTNSFLILGMHAV